MVREKHRGRAARREGKPPKEKKVVTPVQQPVRQASHRSATPLHSSRLVTATYGGEPFRSREPRNDNYSEKFSQGEKIGLAIMVLLMIAAFAFVALVISKSPARSAKSDTNQSNANVEATTEASPAQTQEQDTYYGTF